jgi:hypothetical protein
MSNTHRVDFNEPISSYQIPVFTKDRRNKWVNYGQDNLYPDYLCELFNRSSKHNAILTAKQKWTFGQGIFIKPNSDIRSSIKVSKLYNKPNPFETLNDIFKKVALDRRLYGGYALQIIWDRGGQSIAQIFHLDYSKLRSDISNTKLFYCNDWGNTRKEEVLEFNAFNPNLRKGTQVLYYRDYRPAIKTYPLPDYVAAVPYIEVDVEIANYHRANIQNEFFFGGILNFNNGIPIEEEQKELVKKINRRHGGTNNAGRWIINFSDGKDKEPTVIPIQPNDLDKQFEILNKTVQEEIFVAHRVTSPMILGIKTEGQLGGRTEMIDAFKLFNLNEIQPDQQMFEKLFNDLAFINGVNDAFEIVPLELPKPTLTEQALLQNATRAEVRDLLGLEVEKNPVQMKLDFEATKLNFEEENEIKVFMEFGEDANNYEELTHRNVELFTDIKDYHERKETFARQLEFDNLELLDLYQEFIEGNTPDEKKLLDWVKKNPIADEAAIAKGTGLSEQEVSEILKKLKTEKVLNLVEGAWSINDIRPSASMIKRISDEVNKLSVKYKYTGPKDSKNRPFCGALLDLNKLYTKDEINTISKRVGRNVWTKRGGWQTVKGTDIHLPFCRHTWSSVLVKKK